MDFKKIQKDILKNSKQYSKRHKVKLDADFSLMKLSEEVGELTEAYLILKKKARAEKFVSPKIAKKNVGKELADVIGVVVVLADALKINLEDAIDKKWIHKDY